MENKYDEEGKKQLQVFLYKSENKYLFYMYINVCVRLSFNSAIYRIIRHTFIVMRARKEDAKKSRMLKCF